MATNVWIESGEIKNDYHTLDNSVIVSSGGTAINTSVDSGGHLIVGSGGLISRSRVSSGGFLIGSGGTAIDTKVFSNGIMKCSSGFNCSVTRTEVFLGGYFMISHGAVVDSTTLSGQMQVYSGGIANITTVFSSAWCYLYYGAIANDTVLKGGHLFIDSGGVANNTTIDDHGFLEVSSGGVANNTTIDDHGLLDVSSGGVANNATVNPGGQIRVVNGSMTGIVENGGSAFVSSNATVSFAKNVFSGLVLINNRATVHSGTTANINTLSGGVLEVFSGGTANSTTLRADGELFVYSGGTASNTTISSGGVLYVQGWGARNAVSSGGVLKVYSGGTVFNDTVCSSGAVKVSAFGLADHTTVSNDGRIEVYSGGTANSAAVCFSGRLNVYDNGTANSAAVSSGGSMFVDGVASRTKIFSGGSVSVSGTVISTTVSGGDLTISFNGTANSTTVSGGNLVIRASAVVTDTAVNSDGILRTSGYDCKLTRTTVNSGGTAVVQFAPIVSDMVVNGGELQVLKGATMVQNSASDLTVTNSGHLLVSGLVNGAVVDSKGKVTVESGGMFKNATVTNGSVTAKNGASVSGLTLSSGGILNVSDATNVSQTIVSSGGVVTGVLRDAGLTFSGGTLDLNIAKASADGIFLVDAASYSGFKSDSFSCTLTVTNKQLNGTYNLIWNTAGFNKTVTVKNSVGYEFGTLTVGSGPKELLDGVTYDLKLNGGDLVVTVTGGAIPDPIVSGITLIDERRDITSGMSAIDVKVSAGGILQVLSDGKASNTTVFDGGQFVVESDGDLRGATIYSGGTATIYDDVMAAGVIVDGGVYVIESDGWAYRESGGKLVSSNTIVKNGGTVIVSGGGHCGGVIVSDGGHIIVESDGHLGSAFITSGDVTVKDGVESAGASLLDGGIMVVQSGGTAGCIVSSGGVVKVESGGYLRALTVSSGGVVTGVLHDIYTVFRMYGGTLDLDISNAAPGGEYLIDDDANFDPNEDFNCTLTVDGSQANGTYNLMEYAYEFDTKVITAESPLTVKNTSGAKLGTLSVGQTAEIGGANYTLNLSNDNHLTVTVSGGTPPPTPTGTAKSDIDGNGVSDVMFVWTGNNYAHGYWMNGTSEWQSANSNHPAEWDNLGCYDMTGDGKADSVLFGNVTSEAGIHGAYIGYYADAIDNPDGSTWVNIGYLNNVDNIDWKNKVGNLTGNASGVNSIVWYAPELYALGVWTDGTENWATLSNDFGGAAWTLVGCGDFDGDGKDQVVMSLNGGEVYYVIGIGEENATELAKSDSGWEVRAIGDFKGDDKDDIVAFHAETGLVFMWNDGNSADWSQLGQLNAKDWFVVGAGDYNGDAKDDLLVRQKSTGMLGYYASGDMAQWNTLGYGVDMNWTVIA